MLERAGGELAGRTGGPVGAGTRGTMTVSVQFVGTATTVLRLGGFTLLTDPNFLHRGQWAYLGKGLASRRLTDPALEIEQLPQLDAVVLTPAARRRARCTTCNAAKPTRCNRAERLRAGAAARTRHPATGVPRGSDASRCPTGWFRSDRAG